MGLVDREDVVRFIAGDLVRADNPSGAWAGGTVFTDMPDENPDDPAYSKRYYQNLARRMCDYRDMLIEEPGHVRTIYNSCRYPAPYPLEVIPIIKADIEKIRPLGCVIKRWIADAQQKVRDIIT